MSDHENSDLYKLRHSCEHIFAQAVTELFPGRVKLAVAHISEDGFSNDAQWETPLSEEEFPKIEKKMKEIIKANLPIVAKEVSVEEAREMFKNNSFKLEWLEQFAAESKTITVYWTGDRYFDLCKGPHVEKTGEVKAFKLLSVAGAYWRGDADNEMLTRTYGTAFATQEELDNHLFLLEEAKRRDHRKIGQDLDLFFIDEMVGKGLVMWLPKGTIVKNEIENLAIQMESKGGYVRVQTPHIAKEELFLTSGHLPYYKESMYPAMEMDDATYYMKAMNCPHHHRIFLHKPKSYKDLPLRIAEYGTVYRNELSGTLAGLLRVRGMGMNDAHIYCAKEHIKNEFKSVLELIQEYFKIFGLSNYWFRLSKWSKDHPEKYINEPANWEYTEGVLRDVLEEMQVKYIEVDDEAAFYGPKVDIQFTSVIGRTETMSTVQLDFIAKDRFNLNYIDAEGKENKEVFVIHRAPLSTHERFMAFLIEHFAGSFPVWMSPEQVAIIPVSSKHKEYADQIHAELIKHNLRVEMAEVDETVGNKIRKAQGMKIPYMLIMGDQEVANGTVSVRLRTGEMIGEIKLEEFVERAKEKIMLKALEL